VKAAWDRLALRSQAAEDFPLDEAGCAELRARLSERLRALHAAEVEAHGEMGRVLG
jgi:hypothetical protein